MKKEEVPQDDANMFEGKTRELQYAINDEGKYVAVKSVGWNPKNVVMQQAWDDIEEKIQQARADVKSGKKSVIYFHMVKNMMDVKLLSAYSGIGKWRIKRHLKSENFEKIKRSILEKYAKAFNLKSVSDLQNINE